MRKLHFTTENLGYVATALHQAAEAFTASSGSELLIKTLLSDTAFLLTRKYNECQMKRRTELKFSIPLTNALAILAAQECKAFDLLNGWENSQVKKLVNSKSQDIINQISRCQN